MLMSCIIKRETGVIINLMMIVNAVILKEYVGLQKKTGSEDPGAIQKLGWRLFQAISTVILEEGATK